MILTKDVICDEEVSFGLCLGVSGARIRDENMPVHVSIRRQAHVRVLQVQSDNWSRLTNKGSSHRPYQRRMCHLRDFTSTAFPGHICSVQVVSLSHALVVCKPGWKAVENNGRMND